MSKNAAFKRLLWKEFREDRFIFLILFFAPVLLYTAANSPAMNALREIFISAANMGTFLLLILWAAIKGDREKRGFEYSLTHLPVKPVTTWVTSFLFPAIISAALGFWFGGWNNTLHGWQMSNGASLGALEFLAIYSFCYYFAAAFSKWFAIVIGVTHMGSGGALISIWDHTVTWDIDAKLFTTSIAAGAITASWLFLWLSSRKPLQSRQAISLCIMVLITFLPAVKGIDTSPFAGRKYVDIGLYPGSCYSDLLVGASEHAYSSEAWQMLDNLSGHKLMEKTGKYGVPIGIDLRNRVYFLEPRIKRRMNITRWDMAADKARTVATLPDGLTGTSIHNVSLDTDGRYLLLFTKSMLGDGRDVLLINLRNGGNCVAMTGTNYENMCQVVWLKNKVMIVFNGMLKHDYPVLIKPLFSGNKLNKAVIEDGDIFSIGLETAKASRIMLRGRRS